MTRHSPYAIKLSAVDRSVLEKRSRTHTARHTDVVRAKIVLLGAEGHQNTAIAARLDVHVNVVSMWRKRFFESGLDGLADQPRPGRPRSSPSQVKAGGDPARQPEMQPGWSSTELAARGVAEGLVAMIGPGTVSLADRARGSRSTRRSRHLPSTTAAPGGQLLAFESRHDATVTLDALRHLVSSINQYLGEMDATHARVGGPSDRRSVHGR